MASFFQNRYLIIVFSVISFFLGVAAPTIVKAEVNAYVLGPGDRLKVVVYGEPDLSGETEVDGRGLISTPLIGPTQAGSHTLHEVEVLVASRLAGRYLINPRVSIEVLNYRPFFILGEVNNPGSYPIVNGMSVLNAVALSGGFTYRARKDEMMIVPLPIRLTQTPTRYSIL